MIEFFTRIFDSSDFVARRQAGGWTQGLVWLHNFSDLLIWLAYLAIPLVLSHFARKRRDVPFRGLLLMFSLFILCCGFTHFLEVQTFYVPWYRLSGLVKLLTASISWATVIALIPSTPRAMAMRFPEELEKEIADRKKAQSELAQRARELDHANKRLIEAERQKSEFFANISHELRTPLTLILAPTESLLDGVYGAVSDAQRSGLETIHNNAMRLMQMITGLLDFARLQAGQGEVKRGPVAITRLASAIVGDFQPLLKQKGLRYSLETDPPEANVVTDRYLFERILFNLLSNAVKFTPEGGELQVSLKLEQDILRLAVSDTGIGIAPCDMPALFQRFCQVEGAAARRFEGTGLGLALVKEFTELLQGTVSVTSKPGAGSTFTVEFPAPISHSTVVVDGVESLRGRTDLIQKYGYRAIPIDSEQESRDALPRVLIAEDNEELRLYISAVLYKVCRTDSARNGREARQMIEQAPPDLVLADVMMAELDGYSLCQELKADPRTRDIPVVFLTALTDRTAMLKGWEAGADEYLFKPFHPVELETRVRSLLSVVQGRRQAAEQLRKSHEQLLHSERLAAIGQTVTGLAHESRNALQQIQGGLELLAIQTRDQPECIDLIESIQKAQDRLTHLFEQLRSYGAILKLDRQPTNIACIWQLAWAQLAPERSRRDVRLLEHPAEVDLHCVIDCNAFEQVFRNIIKNSLAACPDPVHIEIHCSATQIQARPALCVVVRDNGPGLTREQLEKLFDPFYTTKTQGSGLGLTIARRIVEAHGGQVVAGNAPGAGAEITLSFPRG